MEVSKAINLGDSYAWSFLPFFEKRLSKCALNLFFYFRPADYKAAPHQILIAWDQMPWPLVIRARSARDTQKEIDVLLATHRIPRPFWKNWPLLVSKENPEKIVALVGIRALEEFQFNSEGRCVCLWNV